MHSADAVVIPFPLPPGRPRRRARARAVAGQHPFLPQGSPWELTLLPSPASPGATEPAEPLVFSLSC
jgi:hypothetical protein